MMLAGAQLFSLEYTARPLLQSLIGGVSKHLKKSAAPMTALAISRVRYCGYLMSLFRLQLCHRCFMLLSMIAHCRRERNKNRPLSKRALELVWSFVPMIMTIVATMVLRLS